MDKKDSESGKNTANQETSPCAIAVHDQQKQSEQPEPAKKDASDELYSWEEPALGRIRRCCIKCRVGWRKTEFHDQCTIVVTGIGLLVLIIYTIFTGEMWRANKTAADAAARAAKASQEQTRLMGQQLEGTLGAILRVIIEPQIDQNRLTVSLMNIGHVFAKDVRVNLEISERRVPSEELIGKPIIACYTLAEIDLSQDRYQTREYPLGLSVGDVERIKNTKQTIRTEGTISYFNGFSKTTLPICFSYLTFEVRTSKGNVRRSGSNPQVPCDEYDLWIPGILSEKRRVMEDALKNP